ncbi:hypothetical protein [Halobacterium bonnevillei]|uniref:Uncharacterized protein n=1 Tax=Halobacterium bonnevillei TaxID=2692200 RepID=A0A6B0SNP3_9EURY|nr:hypothetical protein [Halobacterium bonnevillei]MXR22106.1 hypothetical protein [Halobacterium bonnevillei]
MTDAIDLPTEELDDAETLADVQANVARANEALVARADRHDGERYESAGVSFDLDSNGVTESLQEWLTKLRGRVDELAREEGVESYTVSVTGGVTGVSIQLGMTYAPDTDR